MQNTTAAPTSEISWPNPSRVLPAKIWRALSYIQDHFEEELSLATVAGAVGISPNHLSEKFKEVTGVKFVDYIARTRFEKARALIPDRQLRISEIAFEVGFQSLSQFNRVFKRLSGLSPTEYRALRLRLNGHFREELASPFISPSHCPEKCVAGESHSA